tara:strand:+ start:446 stop:1195 length:750 start_codon:yes stop_codon:yes gene_type:complete
MVNDIKLQEGHPVDENLRPLKVGGKSTSLETAQSGDGARVNGDLQVTETLMPKKIADFASDSLTISDSRAITLDYTTGIRAKQSGDEFSVRDSAFAGMILGYRMIGEDTSHASYTLTTSFVVPDSNMTVRFVAPPSGAVEIMVQVFCNTNTSNRIVYFGLSDNATYNTLGAGYEQIAYYPDESDDNVVQHYWAVTGLTAGDTYNYWLGAKISGTTGYLAWGGTGTGRYCDFIMKATALPKAISDFAVYG